MRRFLTLLLPLLALPLLGLGCINVKTAKTTDGGIYKSEDSAESWEQKVFVRQEKKETITINSETIKSITFHPDDKEIIYINTRDKGYYRSQDSGETWTQFKAGANYKRLSIDPTTPSIVYVSKGSKIHKTVDDGENWDNIYIEPNGKTIVNVSIDSYDPSRIWALTNSGDLLLSQDWGETWAVHKRLSLTTNNLYIDPEDTRVMYITTPNQGIWKSINGGDKWNDILVSFKETKNEDKIYGLTKFQMIEQAPEILYIITLHGIYRSWNGGADWEQINTLQPAASVTISAVAANPENHDEMYFSIGKVIHKTTDNGENWKTIETFPSARIINQLVVQPEDPTVIWAGTYIPAKK